MQRQERRLHLAQETEVIFQAVYEGQKQPNLKNALVSDVMDGQKILSANRRKNCARSLAHLHTAGPPERVIPQQGFHILVPCHPGEPALLGK